MKHLLITMLLPVLLLTACGDGRQVAVVTDPAPLDREAIGRYCQMIVADHPGPKAQILLDDGSAPIWFSSVRDGIAFTRLPEEPRNIAAFYVNDMSDTDWEHPDDSSWISAGSAARPGHSPQPMVERCCDSTPFPLITSSARYRHRRCPRKRTLCIAQRCRPCVLAMAICRAV